MANNFDWQALGAMGFSNQTMPEENVNQLSPAMTPAMTPEQLKKLKEQIAKASGGTVVANVNTPSAMAPPQTNAMLSRLSVGGFSSDPQSAALSADLRELYKILEPGVRQGIEKQNQTIDDFKATPNSIDFTPMAALADKWSGNGTGNQLTQAAAAAKGLSPQEKIEKLLKMQGQPQDDAKALLTELGTRMNNKEQMSMMKAAMQNQRTLAGQDFKMANDFNTQVRQDVKPYYEIMPSYGTVLSALTPDANGQVNVQRLSQALSAASRINGEKGVLTDQDIGRVQKQTIDMYIANFQALAGDPSATVPVAQIAPLLRSIREGQASWNNALQRKLMATGETAKAMGLNPEFANKVTQDIYGSGGFSKNEAPPSAVPPQAPAQSGPSIKDILGKK